MANLVSQKAKMTFSLAGKQRPNKPDANVLDAIQGAVTKALGPGYSVNVYSGKENPGHQHGSNRHKTGLAADVHIVGPDGKTLNARENKQQMLDVAKAFKELGGMGVGLGTDYMNGTGIHLDMFTPGPNQDTAWGNIGNAMQGWLDGFYRDPNRVQLPETAPVPQTLAQVQAQDLAYANMEVQRAKALSAMPAPSLERPNPMPGGLFPSAPSAFRPDNLNRGLFGRDSFAPALASAPSIPSVPATGRDRFGPVAAQTTVATRPSTPAPTSLPSARPTQVASIGRPDYASIAGTEIGRMAGPAPARAPSTADLAAAYGQYGATRTAADKAEAQAYADFEAQRAKAFSAMPAPSYPAAPTAPIAPAPPVEAVPPAPVLAPALAPPKEVKDYPVPDIAMAPAPPKATASDVYAGLADTALDNTGLNTVSRDAFGNTTVANQYGATTAMTPGGYQSAYGNLPSLPGISGPVKGALPGIAGSMVGGYLGGPVGAIAGGLLGKAFAPGGIFSGTKKIDTSQIPAALGLPAVTAFARPNNSLNSFPSAPSGGYRGSASFSNRSRGEMADISPAAADAIGRGQGGLY